MNNNVKLDDIEQYRIQMAAISTAAIGYWTEEEGIHPDYDTPALRDVAKLYAKYAALHAAAEQPGTAGAAKGGADIGKFDNSAAQNAEAIRNAALFEASEVCNKICKEYQGHAARRGVDDEDFYDAYMNKSLAASECMDAIRALQSGTATSQPSETDEDDDACRFCEGQGEVQGYGSAPDIDPPIKKCSECGGSGKSGFLKNGGNNG